MDLKTACALFFSRTSCCSSLEAQTGNLEPIKLIFGTNWRIEEWIASMKIFVAESTPYSEKINAQS